MKEELQFLYGKLQRIFWELKAKELYKKRLKRGLGLEKEPIIYIINKYKPKSILDIGCGSGRFFSLYKELKITDITGIDISKKALSLARNQHPDVNLIWGRIETTKFNRKFDLAISNRTLQHVTKRNIYKAIANICECCNLVYLNELTESEDISDGIVIYKHDYVNLFSKFGFKLIETGKIKNKMWMLFGKC